jgi:methyl-accepting chemotaxis protein
MRQTALRNDILVASALLVAMLGAVFSVGILAGPDTVSGILAAVVAMALGCAYSLIAAERIAQHEARRQRTFAAETASHTTSLAGGVAKMTRPLLLVDGTGQIVAASAGILELSRDVPSLVGGGVGTKLSDHLPGLELPRGVALSRHLPTSAGVLSAILTPLPDGTLVELSCDRDRIAPLVEAIEQLASGGLSKPEEFDGAVAAALQATENTIVAAIEDAEEALAQLAAREWTSRMPGRYAPAFQRLASAFNASAEKIESIIRHTEAGIDGFRASVDDVAAGARQLAMRTEQQASSLEETAAAMEEIAAAAKNAAENAERASKLATTARTGADRGATVSSSAIAAMGRIEESSERIAQIVGLIDEIAFQTNLLALNAAVEAARAGDAGKGFAVVASEVRSLSGRTSQASKEIKTLISNSRASVSSGVELVRSTEAELVKIVDLVADLDRILSEIAVASRQQSEGISEVASTVASLDEITQANAALVEKTSLALNETQRRAGELKDFLRTDAAASKHPPLPSDTASTKPAPIQRAPFSSSVRAPAKAIASPPSPHRDARTMQGALQRSFSVRSPPVGAREPHAAAVPQAGTAGAKALLVHDDEWEEF